MGVITILIKFILLSGLMTLFYYAFFRGKASFTSIRIFIISIPAVCILFSIPTIKVDSLKGQFFISDYLGTASAPPSTNTPHEIAVPLTIAAETEIAQVFPEAPQDITPAATDSEHVAVPAYETTPHITDMQAKGTVPARKFLPAIIYVIGVTACFTIILSQILWVLRIKRRSGFERNGKSRVYRSVVIDNPFSFMKDIFIPGDCTGDKYMMIVAHEKEHVRRSHYIDLILMGFYLAVFWFNPFIWLLRRELESVHEFEVDDSVMKKGCYNKNLYMKTILEESVENVPVLTNGFKSSLIKERFVKMEKGHRIKQKAMRSLLTVPFVALLFAVFAFTSAAEDTSASTEELYNETGADITLRHEPEEVTGHTYGTPDAPAIPEDGTAYEMTASYTAEDGRYKLDIVITEPEVNESFSTGIYNDDIDIADNYVAFAAATLSDFFKNFQESTGTTDLTHLFNAYETGDYAVIETEDKADPLKGIPTHNPDGFEIPDNFRFLIKKYNAVPLPQSSVDVFVGPRNNNSKILSIEVTKKETRVKVPYYMFADWLWGFWDKNTCLVDKATGDRYMLRDIKGVAEPGRLYIHPYGLRGETIVTTLIFPPLDNSVEIIDFYEPANYVNVPKDGNRGGLVVKNIKVDDYNPAKVKTGRIIR